MSGHIMISYEHGTQKEVISLKQRLEKMGHRIWIDFEQMHGNTVNAMIQAIEGAYIFMPVLSEGYEQSETCRREFEYAQKSKKDFIPVIVTTNYRPKGWISFMLGNTYFYNCLKEVENDKFEQRLRERASVLQGQKTIGSQPQSKMPFPNTPPPPYTPQVKQEDEEDSSDDESNGASSGINPLALMMAGVLGGLVITVKKPVHQGISCDGCGDQEISGARYKCCVCQNYDLCESCHSKPRFQVHDQSHLFMQFKTPQRNAPILVGLTRQAAIKFSQKVDTSSNVHRTQCNKCRRNPILGRRFKCMVCDDFDLCLQCEANSRSFHDENHPMIVFCYPASSDDQAAALLAALLLASLT